MNEENQRDTIFFFQIPTKRNALIFLNVIVAMYTLVGFYEPIPSL